MAEQAKRYMDDFINSAPLFCRWPRETVLITIDEIYLNETDSRHVDIYLNEPGSRHVEEVFLEKFRENMEDPSSTIHMYLSYSPCNVCSTSIIHFLQDYPELKFDIKFAHVYYKEQRDSEEIREGLGLLEAHDKITLKAIGEEDWKEIMTLILRDQGLDEWAQGDVEEWSTTKDIILDQPVVWEDFYNALRRSKYMNFRSVCELVQTSNADDLNEIMTNGNDHENWGNKVGNYLQDKNRRELHNIAMQLLYNHGEGSLQRIVDAANGEGYAFLLRVLKASREAEMGDLLQLLRRRIIADFVADKEFRYIIDKQIDGEADAAVGNDEAAAAAE